MKIGKRELICSGAIGGLLLGWNISAMLYGEPFFNEITPRHIIVIVFCIVAGGFIGHVLRHAPKEQDIEDHEND